MEKSVQSNLKMSLQIQNPVVVFNRVALFVVYFWFGFLKVLAISPAEGLVTRLHTQTISSYITITHFLIFLGAFECLIGILWLFPKYTNIAFALFSAQMLTTFLPLFYLPNDTWQNGFALTLTGQYIIKNVVLIASAFTVLMYGKYKLVKINSQNI
ncbi:MAG: hypothetical protein IPO78_12605 [Saprospiraceae bacterium]|nr:hypothetical protein [Saprospiraceae bacterium]MBK8451244.1 hypothetical protein [Saprospiraceae bacterium]MBK9220715.1 hypothetical protein [Saprospiraceae bacterium]MBK9722440.1 hypothetical protein [Saprospiraceae bacterium]